MKKNVVLLTVALFAMPVVYAYNAYNHLPITIDFHDSMYDGMQVTIAPNAKSSCKPSSKGCSGLRDISIRSLDGNILCHWGRSIPEGKGYYLVVSLSSYPDQSICKIELFRDRTQE